MALVGKLSEFVTVCNTKLRFKEIVGTTLVDHAPPAFLFTKTTCSRRSTVKLYTLFKTRDPENHSLLGGTYPFRPTKGVAPTSGDRAEACRESLKKRSCQFSVSDQNSPKEENE